MIYIYLTYSKIEQARENSQILRIADYLESPCSDGKEHAIITNHPGRQQSAKASVRDLTGNKNQTGQVVLFLCSDNTALGQNVDNIRNDIRTAKKLKYNVVFCPLPGSGNHNIPGWLSKLDKDVKYIEFRNLKKSIELHDAKKYKVFKDSASNPILEPDFRAMRPLDLDPRVFEQYKIYKQEIEQKENARRISSDAFMTVNSAFVAFLGVVLDRERLFSLQNIGILCMMGFTGHKFCSAWESALNYYKQITTAKQRVINHLEKYLLPLLLNSTEYYDVMQSPFNKRYKTFDDSQALLKVFRWLWRFCFILAAGLLFYLLLFHSEGIPDMTIKIL